MQGMLKSLTGRILIVLMLSNSAFVFGATCLIQSYPENSLAKIDNEYLKADKISLVDKQILKLYGEIELGLERGFLKADTAILNKTANTIKGIKNGEVLFSDALFQFQNGSINRNTGQINLENGNAILKNKKLKFQFKDLSSIDRSELLFRDVSFSSCSEPSKGWEISAKEVLVNQESKRGVINVLELKIFENRLFRLPKVPFPATDQRLSGILEPDIAITSDGIDFYIPFYIVTSQKSDITVAPRLINERGLGIESNVRYLSGGRLNQINVLYFDNDKKFHNNQLYLCANCWGCLQGLFTQNHNTSYVNLWFIDFEQPSVSKLTLRCLPWRPRHGALSKFNRLRHVQRCVGFLESYGSHHWHQQERLPFNGNPSLSRRPVKNKKLYRVSSRGGSTYRSNQSRPTMGSGAYGISRRKSRTASLGFWR